jgi:hypothetical protein
MRVIHEVGLKFGRRRIEIIDLLTQANSLLPVIGSSALEKAGLTDQLCLFVF